MRFNASHTQLWAVLQCEWDSQETIIFCLSLQWHMICNAVIFLSPHCECELALQFHLTSYPVSLPVPTDNCISAEGEQRHYCIWLLVSLCSFAKDAICTWDDSKFNNSLIHIARCNLLSNLWSGNVLHVKVSLTWLLFFTGNLSTQTGICFMTPTTHKNLNWELLELCNTGQCSFHVIFVFYTVHYISCQFTTVKYYISSKQCKCNNYLL